MFGFEPKTAYSASDMPGIVGVLNRASPSDDRVNRYILPILTVNFVGTLGFSVVMPSLVFVVTRLGGNAVMFGSIGAAYSLFQLIGAPILGRWSDRYGRRRILLLCQVGTFVSWAVFLIAVAIPRVPLVTVDSSLLGAFTLTAPLVVLFAARALDGLTDADVSIANAYLADITDDRHRREYFGKMGASSNLGFVAGPALAGLIGAMGLSEFVPAIAALVISALAIGIVAFGLPEAAPRIVDKDPDQVGVAKLLGRQQKGCFTPRDAGDLAVAEILALPSMIVLLSVYFLVFLGFNLFYVAFPVYATTSMAWSLSRIGAYFAAMGLMMALAQGPLLKHLSRWRSDRDLVVAGSILLAASFPFFLSSSTILIYIGTALLAVGNGLMWPSLMATLSKTTEPRAQGAVQGLASSLGACAGIAGLLAGGVLYHWLGGRVFLLSAALIAASSALAFAIPARSNTLD
jgi:MFS transporter, DHA1 family, tetracycline resistance protein